MKQEYSRREAQILNLSLSFMYQAGFERTNIEELAKWSKLDSSILRGLFESDVDLQMKTMEYAATVWVAKIRREAEKIESREDRIRYILKEFAFGTDEYANSLSLYIDLWKQIRDLDDCTQNEKRYLKDTLLDIYHYYASFFCELCFDSKSTSEANAISWLMVVLSDGIHIQSLLENPDIDKEAILNQLYLLTLSNMV